MTEQLALVEVAAEPKLTDRQHLALDLVKTAGIDGIHADEVGAGVHADRGTHSPEQRCRWCGATGRELLLALKKKGLVRYRRGKDGVAGYWQAVGAQDGKSISPLYNQFPEGF